MPRSVFLPVIIKMFEVRLAAAERFVVVAAKDCDRFKLESTEESPRLLVLSSPGLSKFLPEPPRRL